MQSPRRKRAAAIATASLLLDAMPVLVRAHKLGGAVVVRCRQAHQFTTVWIPGASLTSLRLGWWRVQRCPVGRHWSIVTPVARSKLSSGP